MEDLSNYELVWSDEFDYNGVPDPAKWTFESGFVRNRELQWYQANNAFCEDGLLVIEGRRETMPNPNYVEGSDDWRTERPDVQYTSASVTTRGLHDWQYGIFEVSARIVPEEGLWPAIWTLGSGHEWPTGGEIDIMEYYDGGILANAAWAGEKRYQAPWDDAKIPVEQIGDPGFWKKFHVWRMEWDATSIDIFLDSLLLNTIDLDETVNQRGEVNNPLRETSHYILLNLAIGGTQGGDPSKTSFPTRYEIDYVRVYQKGEGS